MEQWGRKQGFVFSVLRSSLPSLASQGQTVRILRLTSPDLVSPDEVRIKDYRSQGLFSFYSQSLEAAEQTSQKCPNLGTSIVNGFSKKFPPLTTLLVSQEMASLRWILRTLSQRPSLDIKSFQSFHVLPAEDLFKQSDGLIERYWLFSCAPDWLTIDLCLFFLLHLIWPDLGTVSSCLTTPSDWEELQIIFHLYF